uniref:B30.2/SPRY domain-containing protein n=1 Tax=Astatotilapia calliptera TaxID=8154 RepID=A0AAX7TGA3_ASTCA
GVQGEEKRGKHCSLWCPCAADHSVRYVACDVCSGRKLKAFKSCLHCVVSYCERHLQPHNNVDGLKKHKLVNPFKKLQENMCSHHNEVMKIFCRTDQQCICYLCSMGEHKGHDTVPASTERTEKQKELKPCLENFQIRIQDREEHVKVFLQEMEAINQSADKAVRDTEKTFEQIFFHIKEKNSDIQKHAELEQLSHTEDHTQFLHMFPLFSNFTESTEIPFTKRHPLLYFDDVPAAVLEVKNKLQDDLQEGWQKVSRTVTDVDVLLPQPEPQTRAEFLKFSTQLTLDPDTVNMRLLLSEENRRATFVSKKQAYPGHPERFMNRSQVLSRESLTGCHYWEVEWSGFGIYIAVAYKSISRTGDQSEFGNNSESWALDCYSSNYSLSHGKNCYRFTGPVSSKIGVYLDHKAGILSFYSVSGTMTLLHRVQTTFNQPLYVGLRASHFLGSDSSAVFV